MHVVSKLLGVLCVACMLFTTPFYASDRAHSYPSGAFHVRMVELIWFVESKTHYRARSGLPDIVFVPSDQLNRDYAQLSGIEYTGVELAAAYYNQYLDQIVLPEWFELGKHDDILVHEIGHWLQDISGAIFPCRERHEAQAYRVQAQFIEQYGVWEPGKTADPFTYQYRICPSEFATFELRAHDEILFGVWEHK